MKFNSGVISAVAVGYALIILSNVEGMKLVKRDQGIPERAGKNRGLFNGSIWSQGAKNVVGSTADLGKSISDNGGNALISAGAGGEQVVNGGLSAILGNAAVPLTKFVSNVADLGKNTLGGAQQLGQQAAMAGGQLIDESV